MYTPLLILAVLILPAAWGCLMELALWRVWPHSTAPVVTVATATPPGENPAASVDFQI